MSTNGVNIAEDADMAECEEEKVVTMMDVLQEQQEFEDDANAVLGASDDKNCTYARGYIKRQAIYACLTCCSDAKVDPTKRAGVCLACSLNCHENHELIELYTKRSFRCDCGNPKFNSHPCQFVPEKPDLNEDNSYNQNFSGLYCTCHRPYPDPESTFEDEMIQCVVCEDWLHSQHLEASPPNCEYAEMICKACMDKNEFLHDYSDIVLNNEMEDVDVINVSTVDTSLVVNPNECNGVLLNVNGIIEESGEKKNEDEEMTESTIAIDKVESVADTTGTKELVSTTDEKLTDSTKDKLMDTTVPEANDNRIVSTDDNKDVEKPNKEDSEVTNQATEDNGKPEEIVDSKDADMGASTNQENDNKTEKDENDKNKSNEVSTDSKMDTADQTNDNSIIDSIEKLESELGNSVPEQTSEQNKQEESVVPEAKVEETDSKKTDDQTEEKENTSALENTGTEIGDSIVADIPKENEDSDSKDESNEEDKQNSIDDKENDLKINETNDLDKMNNVKPETNVTVDSSVKASEPEPVENGSGTSLNNCEEKAEESTNIKRKLSTEECEDITSKKAKLHEKDCTRPKRVKRKFKGATFWPSNFRQKLCTCNECISMYKDLSVLFLIDPEDTVTAYEALGKEKIDGTATSQYEKGLEALSSLDRIQQINALTEYNKMRDKLLDYLKSFKERKEIVKEEDIKAFFAGMKPKRESDGVYFCR